MTLKLNEIKSRTEKTRHYLNSFANRQIGLTHNGSYQLASDLLRVISCLEKCIEQRNDFIGQTEQRRMQEKVNEISGANYELEAILNGG